MKIAVIGNGIIGQLVALELVNRGYQPTIFTLGNRRESQGATYAAAGLITPGFESIKAVPMLYMLGSDSCHRWTQILRTLPSKVLHRFEGSLVTCTVQYDFELARTQRILKQKQPTLPFDSLSSDEIHRLEPELTTSSALFIPNEGFIDSRALIDSLSQALASPLAVWQENTHVTAIMPGVVHTSEHQHKFDFIFDCRGLGAKKSFPQLRGVRGEIIHLQAPEVTLRYPIHLVLPQQTLYIVPLSDHRFIIGATEIETEDTSPISVYSCLEILTNLIKLHSGFLHATIIETVVGLRPALPNNLPIIQHQQHIIAINGLYRYGFLLAPAIAQQAIQLFESRCIDKRFSSLISGVSDERNLY